MSTLTAEPDLKVAHPHARARTGLLYGVATYLMWGFVPLYFHALNHVPPIQILANRVIWSLLFVAILTTLTGKWDALPHLLRHRRSMLLLVASTLVLSVNWYTFIYSVQINQVKEASLGYFINPLLSVALGMAVLRERLRPWQAVALAIACGGVLFITISRGQIPWIALIVAISFAIYGLLRKIATVGPMLGLLIETALLTVPAIFIVSRHHATYDMSTKFLLGAAGVVTAVPLLCFVAATHRLRLSTMGFLQYMGPTCQFLLAVFAFHERLRPTDLFSFSLIWSALLIYSWDSYRAFAAQRLLQGGAKEPANEALEPA